MHSLHPPPQHVRLSMPMFPSGKNSFTPEDASNSSLRFFFALSLSSDKSPNMSTFEEFFSGIFLFRCCSYGFLVVFFFELDGVHVFLCALPRLVPQDSRHYRNVPVR